MTGLGVFVVLGRERTSQECMFLTWSAGWVLGSFPEAGFIQVDLVGRELMATETWASIICRWEESEIVHRKCVT